VENHVTESERHLQRYLRLATWGLWGRQKREVRQELEGNIREMVLEQQLSGLTPHESLEQALRAFGKPELVNAGMIRVYTMPILMRNTLLAATFIALSIGTINSSTAQVLTSDRAPLEPCLNPTKTEFKVGENTYSCSNWVNINVASLKAVLEPLGVTFTSPLGGPTINPTLYATFPGGREIVMVRSEEIYYSSDSDYNPENFEPVKLLPGFLDVHRFFEALSTSGLPVTLEGWDKALIRVGKVSFTLGTPENPLKSEIVFFHALYEGLESFFAPRLLSQSPPRTDLADSLLLSTSSDQLPHEPSSSRQPEPEPFCRYQIRLKNPQPDTVYAVLSREGKTTVYSNDGPRMIDSYRRVEARIPTDSVLEYASAASTLRAGISSLNLEQIKPDVLGQIVVARFTGRFDRGAKSFEIVPPDQFTIERVK
jgi:hypothetical protein